MTLLSSSHRSLIKVFSLSGTLRGMNKIECFFKCQRKNIFPSGYTHWCWKVFSNWIFKFPFLNSLIIWLYNGGKLLWLKYIYIYVYLIYIYIYPWVHLRKRRFRWRMNEFSFQCFSVLPPIRLLRDPTTISSVHFSSESTLLQNVPFTPSRLFLEGALFSDRH